MKLVIVKSLNGQSLTSILLHRNAIPGIQRGHRISAQERMTSKPERFRRSVTSSIVSQFWGSLGLANPSFAAMSSGSSHTRVRVEISLVLG